jgi:uncharacterized protein (TIGR02246 family)
MRFKYVLLVLHFATFAHASDRDKQAIMDLQKQWEVAFKNKDPKTLANLFTEDCVRMPDGAPTTKGRAVLEDAYRKEFADIWKTKFDASIHTDEVVESGDYGFARGTDTLSQEMNGKRTSETGKWMATYKRRPDGSWKYFWSTYNSNH